MSLVGAVDGSCGCFTEMGSAVEKQFEREEEEEGGGRDGLCLTEGEQVKCRHCPLSGSLPLLYHPTQNSLSLLHKNHPPKMF